MQIKHSLFPSLLSILITQKKPVKVNGYDFPSPEVPRAYPYGIHRQGDTEAAAAKDQTASIRIIRC
ncbi:MAG: hypothetical protein WCQ99_17190 [Pseudomonadota bacterium]